MLEKLHLSSFLTSLPRGGKRKGGGKGNLKEGNALSTLPAWKKGGKGRGRGGGSHRRRVLTTWVFGVFGQGEKKRKKKERKGGLESS